MTKRRNRFCRVYKGLRDRERPYTFEMNMWNRNRLSFFLVSLGGVRLSPLGTSATADLLYQPRVIYDDNYGAVGGMGIGRWNRSTRKNPSPVPLCPPQISRDLTWDRPRAAAVGSQRLTAWAMARPNRLYCVSHEFKNNNIRQKKTNDSSRSKDE
jgi:hypothetical protein